MPQYFTRLSNHVLSERGRKLLNCSWETWCYPQSPAQESLVVHLSEPAHSPWVWAPSAPGFSFLQVCTLRGRSFCTNSFCLPPSWEIQRTPGSQFDQAQHQLLQELWYWISGRWISQSVCLSYLHSFPHFQINK